jgi:hypothetical protein
VADEWWWCLKHQRAEHAPDVKDAMRMGPYESKEAAENWKDRLDARNEEWEKEDERWEGER